MSSSTDQDLGPVLSMVIGPDPLMRCLPAGVEPDGVSHLRPEREGRDVMVLHSHEAGAREVSSAADRLLWLDGRAGAPALLASGRSDGRLESAVIRMPWGAVSAADPLHPVAPESMARLLGSALRRIHEIPTTGCPYESGVGTWRERAASRVRNGELPTTTDGPYAGVEPGRLLDVLDDLIEGLSERSSEDSDVLVHGSPALAHTWLIPDGTMAFTGWQHCGLGDRHHDLAIAAAALADRYGPPLIPVMLDEYGLDLVDPRRLDLHQLLAHLSGAAR